jgi:hypothetical protein
VFLQSFVLPSNVDLWRISFTAFIGDHVQMAANLNSVVWDNNDGLNHAVDVAPTPDNQDPEYIAACAPGSNCLLNWSSGVSGQETFTWWTNYHWTPSQGIYQWVVC